MRLSTLREWAPMTMRSPACDRTGLRSTHRRKLIRAEPAPEGEGLRKIFPYAVM